MRGNRPQAQPAAATCATEIFQRSPPLVGLPVGTCRHPKHCKSKHCQKITGQPEKRQTAAAGGKEIRSHRWVNRQANRARAGWGARRDSGRSNRPLERAMGGGGGTFRLLFALDLLLQGYVSEQRSLLGTAWSQSPRKYNERPASASSQTV